MIQRQTKLIRAMRLWALVVFFCAGLGACHLPPRHPQSPPQADALPLDAADTEIEALWPQTQWWKALQDEQLNGLIDRALATAPDLQQAQARLTVALRAVDQTRAELGVRLDARAQAERTRMTKNLGLLNGGAQSSDSAGSGPSVTSLGLVGVQFQYDFDWWGQRRAAVDAQLHRARASAAEREAAALMLENAVADRYCGWLLDQQRLALVLQSINADESSLQIAKLRRQQGIDGADQEEMARSDLASARAAQAELIGSRRLRIVQLAALLNVAPEQLPALTPKSLPQIQAGVPSDVRLNLLGRRPDIVASRWRIEAAGADVEQARAAYLPDLSISALAFFVSDDFKKLIEPNSELWSVGPALTLPIFEGGRIRARYGSSRAELDSAIADYNKTVIEAASEVGGRVATLQQIKVQRAQQQLRVAASGALLRNSTARAHQGLVDRRALNSAAIAALNDEDTALQLDGQFLSQQLALIKALGGGFDEGAIPALQPHAQALTKAGGSGADER